MTPARRPAPSAPSPGFVAPSFSSIDITRTLGLYVAAILVFAWPTEGLSSDAVMWLTVFPTAMGLALYIALRRGALLTGLIVTIYGFAYAPGMGDAVTSGVERDGIYATASSAQSALAVLCCFLVGLAAVSALTVSLGHRRRRTPVKLLLPRQSLAFYAGFITLAIACLASAIQTGFWTYWRPAVEGSETDATFRLELLYHSLLFVGGALLILARPRRGYWTTRSSAFRWVLILLVTILIFALQARRTMFAVAALAILHMMLSRQTPQRRRTRASRRRWLRVGLVGAVLVIAVFASAAYRSQLRDNPDERGLISSLSDLVSNTDSLSSFSRDEFDARLTYLWLDANAYEFAGQHSDRLDMESALKHAVASALPGTLFPGKYSVPIVTCESIFAARGIEQDLPCTATAEGVLAGGLLPVTLLTLLWGLSLGLVDLAVTFSNRFLLLFGLCCLVPFISVEASMFPMISGLRNALLITIFTIATTLMWRLLTRAVPDR